MGLFLRLWLLVSPNWRLRVYHILTRIGLRLYGPTLSPHRCFRLPFNLYAKTSKRGMTEPDAMRYVSEHTTMPIPRVIDAIPVEDGAVFVMTRISGEPMTGRITGFTEEERSFLASDLKQGFDQLRTLPPPNSGPLICGFDWGSFVCYRINDDPIGPFGTEPEFYQFLYDHWHLKMQDHLKEFGRDVHSKKHRICFSHNDLCPHNIILDDNKRLAGVIDWECAAWLPDYWEYTRACYYCQLGKEWQQMMVDVFGPWPEELRVEQEMWKYNDPW
ncbi:hypothetical protein AMATHDRAFT_70842 [Amanita thiersii Skay4041]|uniref:Aminoglycoside phosphotransferase domain-containing protein n=1 Tax=Amanita thiersii Skay4041 TaxID=703135 RepID=A0A2A9N7D8_9AGAR|nr:hypothetical protein AMATHDRAFT_70842 [Amanita thiersii Skay4041]